MIDRTKQPISCKIIDRLRGLMGYGFPPLGSFANKAVFKLLPQECMVELLPGINIEAHFDDLTYRTTYWQGKRFEGRAVDQLLRWLTNDKSWVFFDIGSNYGFFSLQVHYHRKNTIVHAFEPNPVTYERLRENAVCNKLNRLHTHPVGISDQEGELLLHHGITDLGHSTFGIHPDLQHASSTPAKVYSFDDWVELAGSRGELNGNRDWVAKIDVEGFEPRVLRGMSKSLEARMFKGIMVEVNPFTLQFNGFSPSDILAQMKNYGYHPLFKGDSDPFGNQFFERAL